MRVLVGCEESQAVTIELRKLGHEAFSCDLLPTSGLHPEWHIKGDVLNILNDGWDMMIAFPPCTDLAVSGARHFERKIKDGTQQKSIEFFMALANCDIPKIVIENPIGIMSGKWRKPDQIIRPFQFGENSTKSTCLWLKNLPKLQSTDIIKTTTHTSKTGKVYDEWWFKSSLISNLEERRKFRSKTFQGIAKALAEQYTAFILSGMGIKEFEKLHISEINRILAENM